jgi:hypothetical protein
MPSAAITTEVKAQEVRAMYRRRSIDISLGILEDAPRRFSVAIDTINQGIPVSGAAMLTIVRDQINSALVQLGES